MEHVKTLLRHDIVPSLRRDGTLRCITGDGRLQRVNRLYPQIQGLCSFPSADSSNAGDGNEAAPRQAPAVSNRGTAAVDAWSGGAVGGLSGGNAARPPDRNPGERVPDRRVDPVLPGAVVSFDEMCSWYEQIDEGLTMPQLVEHWENLNAADGMKPRPGRLSTGE